MYMNINHILLMSNIEIEEVNKKKLMTVAKINLNKTDGLS